MRLADDVMTALPTFAPQGFAKKRNNKSISLPDSQGNVCHYCTTFNPHLNPPELTAAASLEPSRIGVVATLGPARPPVARPSVNSDMLQFHCNL